MNVVVVHSRYLSGPASGENQVVDDEVTLLRDAGHEVAVWQPSPGGGVVDQLRAGASAVWSRRAAREVAALVRDVGADVVHCHNLFPELSPAVLAAADAAGAAVVMTLHNFRMLCLPATLVRDGRPCHDCVGRVPWRGVVHRCYRSSALASGAMAASLTLHRRVGTFGRVSLYLAVSDYVRAEHLAAGWSPDDIAVKPNFAWPTTRRAGAGEYFLYLGRLSPEKGIDRLVARWGTIDAPLLVVGDGPLGEEVRASAPPNVRFTGGVPHDEATALLARARALVVPSICPEGQPRSVLEAYAAGVPIVASRTGGLVEVVEDGSTGLLVEPDDDDAWRAAAARLRDDDETAAFGANAYDRWSTRFTPERACRDLVAAYEHAIDRRRRAGT